jgi:hypothetical protein
MIVRRKSVPLKRSRSVGAPPICFSISTVRSIIASVFAEFCPDLPPRRSMDRRASSLRPRRMSHHGDSGAMKMRTKRGVWKNQYLRLLNLKLKTHGEDPLKCKGHSPSPLVVTFVITKGSSRDNDRADRPGHLESSCAGASEGEGDNLASICWGVCDEETPRNTFQGLSDNKQCK